jgi:hypothetical protein
MTTETPNAPVTQEDKVIEAIRTNAVANPSSIPPQFEGDVEKYITAYKNLQADYTKKSQELADLKAKVKPTDPPKAHETPNPLHIGEPPVEETPQVSIEDLQAEFAETGTVSDESKQAVIKALGIKDPRFVDMYIEGLKSQRQLATDKATEIAGGADEYNKVLLWASKNLKPEQRAALNQALSSPSWELTWTGLVTQYRANKQSNSNEPINAPVGNDTTEVLPYRTHQEMMADLANPKYRQNLDPDFIQLVMKRVAITQFS